MLKTALKSMVNKWATCLKKANPSDSKIMKESPDFESILVPEDNGKRNPVESYTNKYQKHVVCSYGYYLISVHDKFGELLSHTY